MRRTLEGGLWPTFTLVLEKLGQWLLTTQFSTQAHGEELQGIAQQLPSHSKNTKRTKFFLLSNR